MTERVSNGGPIFQSIAMIDPLQLALLKLQPPLQAPGFPWPRHALSEDIVLAVVGGRKPFG